MIVTPSLPVDNNNIFATNIASSDHPIWVADTYNKGDLVTHGNLNWECVTQTQDEPSLTSVNWLNLGVINRFKMFDEKNNTLTVGAINEPITYSLKFNEWVNCLSMLKLTASKVKVVMTDDIEGEVFNRTIDLVDYSAANAYEYFFSEIVQKDSLIIYDLPPYFNATISITITPFNGRKASCGVCACGKQIEIGDLKFGYSVGITDYSRVQFDNFGDFTLIQRGFAKKASLKVNVDKSKVSLIESKLAALRATPAIWIGDISAPETYIYGIFEDFGIVVSNAIFADCSLNLKGVI